jgi:hypothetical protein
MIIVRVRDGGASCALYADLRPSGDLVITGRDQREAQGDSVDGYESVYTIRAAPLPRLCELLAVEHGELLDGLQRLLAPRGVAAGSTWRAWLKAHDVAYELTVR